MNKRLRTIALLTAVLLLCALFFTGCKSKRSDRPTVSPNDKNGNHYVLRIAASNEAWRPLALIEAANRLNAQLAAEGSNDTVELEWETVNDFKNAFPLWIVEDSLPEIIAHKQSIIYKYAKSGHIVDAGYVVNDEVYTDKVPATIREFGRMNGTIYGIPCDTETRVITVYKPALTQLGWTEEQIQAWRADILAGKVTLDELQTLAKQVVDAGLCEYGFMHRPNSGVDWAFFFITFNGGILPQNEAGQNVVSRRALTDCLSFLRENVQMGITPYNLLTDYNWNMLEGNIYPKGKAFCWYGNVATKFDCMHKSNVTGEYFDENYITAPLPVNTAGDPVVCGSSPYLWALTSASQKDEKIAEYCRRIFDNVLDLDLQLEISLNRAHIAITTETAESEVYQADKWMTAANDYVPLMIKYQVSPLRDDLQDMYTDSDEFFHAVQEAEVKALQEGARPIEEIVEDFLAEVTFKMGEGNYVIVD